MSTLEQIIAEEWRERATELAHWAMQTLVNRKDVWGQYSVLTPTERQKLANAGKQGYKAMTLPAVNQRSPEASNVTIDKLTRHFASRRNRKPQIIGLHAKSSEQTSLWFGIDIDNHSSEAHIDDDTSRRNLNAAVAWMRQLQSQGYDPLLLDSNGAGGFHLWVLFSKPAPTDQVFAFVQALISDWQDRSLDKLPETFPKRLKEESLGSWFRLPGLHHTREHHARVWQGDEGLDDPWLSGHAAIDTILASVPGPPPPSLKTKSPPATKRKSNSKNDKSNDDAQPGDNQLSGAGRTFKRKGKPNICVDLDGVLASRTSGSGLGPPLDGAVEFTQELSLHANVIIFTARFSTRSGKARSANATAQLEKRILKWLTSYGFSWHSISTGASKPIANAYIDDRGVSCRPEISGQKAYADALRDVSELI